jgi:N-acetylneuraminic acid mutarotase
MKNFVLNKLLLVLCLVATASTCSASTCELFSEEIASMNDEHLAAGSAIYDGKIYVWSGYNGITNVSRSIVLESYEPAIDTWTTGPAVPDVGRNGFGSFELNGKLYIVGGEKNPSGTFTKTVYRLDLMDPLATWQQINDFPTNIWESAMVIFNGKVYAIGGRHGYGATYNHVYEYDEAKDAWIAKTGMLYSTMAGGIAVYDGKIYVLGGNHKTSESSNEPTNLVQIYDPATDSWSYGTSMERAFSRVGCVQIDNAIWLFSYYSLDPITLVESEVGSYAFKYAPESGQWQQYSFTSPLAPLVIHARNSLPLLGTEVYFTENNSGGTPTNKAFKVDLSSCSDPIKRILTFIDTSVEDGTLYPVKAGKPGQGQLGAFKNMIEADGNLIDAELFDQACEQLQSALEKTDGLEPPDSAPDFLAGPAVSELASMIIDLMDDLGCQ